MLSGNQTGTGMVDSRAQLSPVLGRKSNLIIMDLPFYISFIIAELITENPKKGYAGVYIKIFVDLWVNLILFYKF